MNANRTARPTGFLRWFGLLAALVLAGAAGATPANRAALERHYDRFLVKPLAKCTTCHLPGGKANPESLEEFPHNPLGDRLRRLADEARKSGAPRPALEERLARVAHEDADGDGVDNEAELLLGHNPGDAKDTPAAGELASLEARRAEFAKFLAGYRWRPFEPVRRPAVPTASVEGFEGRNPVDAFLAAGWRANGLVPRPEAPREVLLRRLFIDLVGLNPMPDERAAFLGDTAPGWYERWVDRLLADPRHAERWARHWMDVWRYSDWAGWTDGNQIRDSQPHIWRWRDWIVESLASDKPYDRMVVEMLAADEAVPGDADAVRATGFLARNYKMLSREQWLEDTLKHTSQALMGVTLGCAKCHDHPTDPVPQREYYAMRAVFEPHQVRLDRVPGQLDTARDGVPRVYDAVPPPTWLFVRGDERHPLTNEVVRPGVPAFLGGSLEVDPVRLPADAVWPDRRGFVRDDLRAQAGAAVVSARAALEALDTAKDATPAKREEARRGLDLAGKQQAATLGLLAAEELAAAGAPPANAAATNAVLLQRTAGVAEADLRRWRAAQALANAATNEVAGARKKLEEAERQWADAVHTLAKPLDAAFTPRAVTAYPETSTGRRLALARWLTRPAHPLTARVAVNHVWLRHFGAGIVPTPSDFGRNGRPPSNPELLDWLAAEFMEPTVPDAGGVRAPAWSFRHLHRLIVTSAAYRMGSTPDDRDLAADPDNRFLWRVNSRRIEAEAVRDNVLLASGSLDLTRGGPEVDHRQALTSRRRSLYLRSAAEKQAEFLQVFDGPAITECYLRRPSVIPQQALALGNSEMVLRESAVLARRLSEEAGGDEVRFVKAAFQRILGRDPTGPEQAECLAFLHPAKASAAGERATSGDRNPAAALVRVLFNHNDFVVVR